MSSDTQNTGKSEKRSSRKKKGEFSRKTYLFWFESMLLARRFEEKVGQLYGAQKIRGFCHLYIGQEACVAGSATALTKEDKWITAYRDHIHPIVLGADPRKVMAELFGKETGVSKGKGGSMHLFDKACNFFGGHGIVGAQIPLGAGISFAEKYTKTKNVCLCFMGDGAVRQGAFHETMNLAMLWKLPIIFAIENNGYAMGTSVDRSSINTELYKLGNTYSIPSESVDGMKVEVVHKSVLRAATRARKGEGPTLLEFKTYRYKGHSVSDPARYRSKEEVAEYKKRDPIELVRLTLLKAQIASENELSVIERDVSKRVEECEKFAEESRYPDASQAMSEIYKQTDYPFVTS